MFQEIIDGGFVFQQYDPEAETHWIGADLFGIPITPGTLRPSRLIDRSDELHFVRPGEIVQVHVTDDDLLALKPDDAEVAEVAKASEPFFNQGRIDRWPGIAALIDDMGDRGEVIHGYEDWDLGQIHNHGLRENQREWPEGPRLGTLVESFDTDGHESLHNLKYDPLCAIVFAFARERTDRNWLFLCRVALQIACAGIRYGDRGMNSRGEWYLDTKSVGMAEYSKGSGAQGLGYRPHWYETNVRGLLLVQQLGLDVAPIKIALRSIMGAAMERDPESYAESYGCRTERFWLGILNDGFAITRDAGIARTIERALEWYRYMDEDEETGFTVQDKGYASPWMVVPFYEEQGRAAHLIGRDDLLVEIYRAGVAAWEAAKVIDDDGKHAWVGYRYDNGNAPASHLGVRDPHHVAFCCNFLEMANHPDLEAAERAAFSGIGDSLASVRAGDLTPLSKISARDVDQGAGWTKEAFSLIQNGIRGTWL